MVQQKKTDKKVLRKRPKMVHVGIRVNELMNDEMLQLAVIRNETFSDFARKCLDEGIKRFKN